MTRSSLGLLIGTALLGLGLLPSAGATQQAQERYTSPHGNFSLPVPRLMFGTRIQEREDPDGGAVSFLSDWGSLRRIEYVRIPPEARASMRHPEAREVAYRMFIDSMWVPRIDGIYAGTSVLHGEFLDAGGDRSYFAVVRLPGASPVIEPSTGQRDDWLQGLLVFARGDYLYVVAAAEAQLEEEEEDPAEYPPDMVVAFKGTIEFSESAAPLGTPPSVSGQAIVFSSTRDFNYEIYSMPADGSAPVRLTDHPAHDAFPAWSPDGTKIAFSSDRDGNFEIYVMNADGSDLRRLTHDSTRAGYPAWSPDGTQVVFTGMHDGDPELYVINADGSGLRRLTNAPGIDFMPHWSPDGTQIVFSSVRDGNGGIYVINADGSGLHRLTDDPADDGFPAWSPDGSEIAFIRARGGEGSDIYVMNADGSEPTRLTDGEGAYLIPTWSPDGAKIAFHAQHEGNLEIFVINADGTGLANLTNHPATDVEPDWAR